MDTFELKKELNNNNLNDKLFNDLFDKLFNELKTILSIILLWIIIGISCTFYIINLEDGDIFYNILFDGSSNSYVECKDDSLCYKDKNISQENKNINCKDENIYQDNKNSKESVYSTNSGIYEENKKLSYFNKIIDYFKNCKPITNKIDMKKDDLFSNNIADSKDINNSVSSRIYANTMYNNYQKRSKLEEQILILQSEREKDKNTLSDVLHLAKEGSDIINNK